MGRDAECPGVAGPALLRRVSIFQSNNEPEMGLS